MKIIKRVGAVWRPVGGHPLNREGSSSALVTLSLLVSQAASAAAGGAGSPPERRAVVLRHIAGEALGTSLPVRTVSKPVGQTLNSTFSLPRASSGWAMRSEERVESHRPPLARIGTARLPGTLNSGTSRLGSRQKWLRALSALGPPSRPPALSACAPLRVSAPGPLCGDPHFALSPLLRLLFPLPLLLAVQRNRSTCWHSASLLMFTFPQV